ncbi:MAG TPA: autotransporter assembly complex family protein [Gammaproteobacteria bacterium]|nr:autotransporter assembly complex family protein [Gammaproteobacteria bacterium]
MTPRTGRIASYALCILLLIGAGTAHAAGNPQIEVEIQGVSGDLQKNVLAYLSIETYHDSANLTQSLVDRLNARAPSEIRKALEPYGYYDAQVVADLTATASGWHAKYVITPGIPVRIRKVDIQLSGAGKDDDAFKDYLGKLPLKSGDQLNQPAYENIKQQLQDLAAHRGYIDAHFTDNVLRVDPPEHWADIELRFDTGLRYYFGAVTFTQDFMQPAFLQRYVSFKPGDPYDANQLLNLQYALSDSDYFGSVDIQVLRKQAGPDRRIPIQITLTPRKRNRYSLGLGYGTDTGPRTTLVWENRRLNGLGHRLGAQLEYSRILETAQLNYSIPLANPAWQQLRYSLATTRQELGDGIAYTNTLGVNRNTVLGGWGENQYLNLEQDRSESDTGTIDTRLLVPGLTFNRGTSDNPTYPTRGYRASVDLRGSSDALGSDTSFLQTHLSAKLIFSLTDTTRLLLRGELGATAVSNFAELPLSQRFYTGGDQSVRGYAYNSIGPRDSSGNVLGGKNLLVGSLELDHRLGPVFGVAAFVDAGNVTNSFQASLEKGAGLGLRWRTPVGVVRFDVAHPIKRPDLDHYRIHISIGPDL